MAGTSTSTGGSVIFDLFEEPPNLVPQVVLESMRLETNLIDGLVDLQLHGYSQKVHKYYKYGRDVYTEGLPIGSLSNTALNPTELHRVLLIEAKERLNREAAIQQSITNHLIAISHPNAAASQVKVDNLLALAANPTISNVVGSQVSRLDSDLQIWHKSYYTDGLFFPLPGQDILGVPLLSNTDGYYPQKFTESTQTIVDYLGEYPIYSKGMTHKLVSEDGSITFQHVEYTQDSDINIFGGLDYIEAFYTIDGLSGSAADYLVWQYVIADGTYPDLISTYAESNESPYYPIISIREDKKNLNTELDEEGNPLDEKGYTSMKALEYIQVNMNDILATLEEEANIEDMDDIYVGFFGHLLSEVPGMIRYHIALLEDMRLNNIGSPDDATYDDLLADLARQDAAYEAAFPDIYTLGFGGSSVVDMSYNLSINIPRTVEETTSSFCEFRCGYIYVAEILGVIGKPGFTELYWTPGEGTVPRVHKYLYPNGYIEYKLQISETHYKIARIHKPTTTYTNWWYGRDPQIFKTTYALNGHSVPDSDETLLFPDYTDYLIVPINYQVAKYFSGTTETAIYYASGRIFVFTVHVEFIAGWKKFLKAIFYIILLIIIIVTWGAATPLLGVFTAVGTVITLIVTAVIQIIVKILTVTLGGKAGAIAGVTLGVISAIFSFGTNWSTLIASIPQLTLALLGAVVNFATGIISVVNYGIQEDIQNLLEAKDDALSILDEAEEAANFTDNPLNPLMVGNVFDPYETPTEFFTRTLNTSGITDLSYLVQDYVAISLELPEYNYEADHSVNGLTAFAKLAEAGY